MNYYELCDRFKLKLAIIYNKGWTSEIKSDYGIYFKSGNGGITQKIATSIYKTENACKIGLKQLLACYKIMTNDEVLSEYIYNYERCPKCNMFGFSNYDYKYATEVNKSKMFFTDPDRKPIYYPGLKCSHCDYIYFTSFYFVREEYKSKEDYTKAKEEQDRQYNTIVEKLKIVKEQEAKEKDENRIKNLCSAISYAYKD